MKVRSLTFFQTRSFPGWVVSSSEDISFARWRSKTIPSCSRLFSMNLTYSPLCPDCFNLNTPEDILLDCPRLSGPRHDLFRSLHLTLPISYSTVLIAAFSSSRNLTHFTRFSRLAVESETRETSCLTDSFSFIVNHIFSFWIFEV